MYDLETLNYMNLRASSRCPAMERVQDRLRNIKKAMDRVRADDGLTSNEKRARLDELTEQRNAVLKITSERFKGLRH